MAGENKSSVELKKKPQVWVWLLIFLILFIYLIIALNLIDHFWGSKFTGNPTTNETPPVTTPTASSSPSKPPTTTKTYPKPQPCEPSTFNEEPETPISADNPGLRYISENQYYKIYGWTEADLRNQLVACTLDAGGGAKASAVTMHDITFEFHYDFKDNGMCNIKDVAVAVRTDVIYPQWQRPADPDPAAVTRWDRYFANTKTHEEGHRKYYTDAGQNVYDTLRSIADNTSCQAARTDADNRAYAIIHQAETDSRNYDTATNHGTTQGAVF